MSHIIIITSEAYQVKAEDATPPTFDYNITYRPPHDQTPAEQGAQVAKILRMLDGLKNWEKLT